jgi:hypothetical protein
MPGAASFAAKYPQFSNSMSGKPWMMNSGGGPTLSADSGMGYTPTGQRSDLASVLAGNPTMTGGSGMQMGGNFQKSPGGKPSIGTAGGGGKPSIGYGGGGPTRAARW